MQLCRIRLVRLCDSFSLTAFRSNVRFNHDLVGARPAGYHAAGPNATGGASLCVQIGVVYMVSQTFGRIVYPSIISTIM